MLLLLTRQCRASVRYSLDHLSLGSCGLGSCAGCVGVITHLRRANLTSIGAAIRGAQVGSAPAHPWHARSRLGVRVSNYCERGVCVCV